MPIIACNNANFYYEIHGKGYPLVLISGYTRNALSWLPILEPLSKHFQVLILDNRGVGRTTDSDGELNVELMADDVIALIEILHLATPHIVGQSMGGTIAQNIASRYPDKINKLALLCTSAKWRPAMLRGFKASLHMREKNIDFDMIFEVILPWIYGNEFLNNKEKIAELKRLILEDPYPQSIFNQERQFNVLQTFNGRDQLEKIKAQTLVVYGLQDLVSLPYESKYLAQHIPQTKLLEFDCAHGIISEESEKLTSTLIQFLR